MPSVSRSVVALLRHDLLATASFFDYGCGTGADVAALRSAGVNASGWDPQTAAQQPRQPADVVHLGMVINVIEDNVERRRTLAAAWDLTKRVLAVAVPLSGHCAYARGHEAEEDGAFEKHFTTTELDTFVNGVTGRQGVIVAPGIVLVFRKDDDEQAFLRQRVGGGKRAAPSVDDLLVHLALQVFERRRSFSALPAAVQAEIARFFASEDDALNAARVLLFSASNPELVATASEAAAAAGVAYFEARDGLYVTSGRLGQLPPVLRVFIGCGEQLYGDATGTAVIKVHDRSGKLTFHVYDDFWGQPVPKLLERAKIDLRRQRIDFFAYDGQPHDPQPLYFKSKWLVAGDHLYDDQCAFDTQLAAVPGIEWSGFGPETDELTALLRVRGLRVSGFALQHIRK
ncbi:MAG: hypothetical protein EXR77_03030 [Myxococcales bacterium]|nr:hypothetical protein [Myxococcales bacterium]